VNEDGVLEVGDWVGPYQVQAQAPAGLLSAKRSRHDGNILIRGSWSDPWWGYAPDAGWAVLRRWKSPEQASWSQGATVTIQARDERVVVPWPLRYVPGGAEEISAEQFPTMDVVRYSWGSGVEEKPPNREKATQMTETTQTTPAPAAPVTPAKPAPKRRTTLKSVPTGVDAGKADAAAKDASVLDGVSKPATVKPSAPKAPAKPAAKGPAKATPAPKPATNGKAPAAETNGANKIHAKQDLAKRVVDLVTGAFKDASPEDKDRIAYFLSRCPTPIGEDGLRYWPQGFPAPKTTGAWPKR